MRRIVAYEMVTLDGFIADQDGGLGWAIQDPEVAAYTQEHGSGKVVTFLFGRVTYDLLSSFWLTPEGKKANKFYADSLNNTPKVVISKTLTDPKWQHTTVESNLDEATVAALKQGANGESVMIFGSGTIVSQLLEMDAIDDYLLLVNPVVLGKGKRLFSNVDGMKKLKLAETRTFPSGIALMHYVKAA